MNGQEQAAPVEQRSAFVSHASNDRKKAEALAAELERKGLTCWIAPRDVPPGAEYGEEIIRGIERSKAFILILSSAANMSVHVRREVERAASKGKPIYPVRVEDVGPSPKLEFFISMHHWLDAFDDALPEHASRLAAAIASSEEWIGNKVEQRRRWLSGGFATLAAALLISVAVIFSSDIRRSTLNESEKAKAELADRGVPLDPAAFGKALAAADIETLKLSIVGGISPSIVRQAFAEVGNAASFFNNSQGNEEALDWLRGLLDDRLDPNMTFLTVNGDRVGLLQAALESGHFDAAVTLLEGGASPYIYHDLHLKPQGRMPFLYPFLTLNKLDGLSEDERRRLAAIYVASGAGTPALPPRPDPKEDRDAYDRYPFHYEYTRTRRFEERYDLDITRLESVCTAPRLEVCEVATMRSGGNWCAFERAIPARLVPGEHYQYLIGAPPSGIDLIQLTNVVNDKAYVVTRFDYPGPFSGGLGVAEVSQDARLWSLYKHGWSDWGSGLCEKDKTGSRPRACWRKVELVYAPEAQSLVYEGYEIFKVHQCAEER